jgi:uncharacterized membrane protein YedE/YeeE/rhodanese-related sulfurtransferase
MMAPFATHGMIGDGGSLAIALAIGIAFGWTLERAGLGSARKLMGQFYLTDFTVFKVMFTAIVTAMLGTFWLSRLGLLDLGDIYVPETYIAPQLVGGIVFGIGFALAGLCPGTSCVAAATGRGDGISVAAGMLSGVTITGLAFDRLQRFYESGARGSFTLPQLLHVPYGLVVFGIVAIAVAGFRFTSLISRKTVRASDVLPSSTDLEAAAQGSRRRATIMAATAIALGVVAAVAGSPYPAATARGFSTALRASDRVTATEVASWIKDRRPGLRIIDLRSASTFDDYHVPTAEQHSVESLTMLSVSRDETLVLYGSDERQAVEALTIVRGRAQAFILSGGVTSWLDEVMSPTLPANASTQQTAAFARVSELSRYFGGTPRIGGQASARQSVQQIRKRGC